MRKEKKSGKVMASPATPELSESRAVSGIFYSNSAKPWKSPEGAIRGEEPTGNWPDSLNQIRKVASVYCRTCAIVCCPSAQPDQTQTAGRQPTALSPSCPRMHSEVALVEAFA